MFEVSTKDELKRALLHNEDDVYVVNEKLSKDILERSKKNRFIHYAMLVNGYEIVKVKTFGAFDVKFVKDRNKI